MDSSVFQTQKALYPEIFDFEVLAVMATFVMQYMKNHMFLPGQVEAWSVINNINNLSIGDLPRKELATLVDMMQRNYNYVLNKSWAVNCTRFQVMCWKVFEMFVDKEIRERMTFNRESNPPDLLASVHPSQLEKRFGGLLD